jgi:hypothetical protein
LEVLRAAPNLGGGFLGGRRAASSAPPSAGYGISPEAFVVVMVMVDADGGGWGGVVGAWLAVVGVAG